MKNLSGEMDLHTVSGNAKGSQVSGKQAYDSVSGDVRLEKSITSSIQAKSISGDFEIESLLGTGPYNFHTVSGDLKLKVPVDTHCSLELHSLSGHISCHLPETSSQREHGNQSVEVQGGGVKVTLGSVSGGLKLDS